jgi:hypothetical protein
MGTFDRVSGVHGQGGLTTATTPSVPSGTPSAAKASCCSTTRSTVPGDAHTTPITQRQAIAHCIWAQEFLRAAEHALGIGDHNAAAGTAIDTGINAADAVAGRNLGRRWKGAHEPAAGSSRSRRRRSQRCERAPSPLAAEGPRLNTALIRSHRGRRRPASNRHDGPSRLPPTPPPAPLTRQAEQSSCRFPAEYGGSIPLIRSRGMTC